MERVPDLWPGRPREAGVLVGVGLAAAVPAAPAGAVDQAELHRRQMRVGLVHALTDTAAVGLCATSLACRAKGRAGAGRIYGFLGLPAVGLGGHLAYRQASGAKHAEEVPHIVRDIGHRVGAVTEFPAGECVRRVDDVPALVRHGRDGDQEKSAKGRVRADGYST
ncbi:hypothetical protein [Streptomyces sp. NPDC048521]|uniref:hypothetical protein n=1 Tax=Streptomyces sp. NPDC048521 TaxID=3365566 RepID=UPI003712178C